QTLSTDGNGAAGFHGQDENARADRDCRRRAVGRHMSENRHHWLTRLYPAAWRERYGDEMDELLSGGWGWRDMLDVVRSALVERLRHSSGAGVESMATYPRNVAVLVRKPSAIVHIAISLCALSVVLLAIANGSARPQ